MESAIARAINCQHEPVALLWSDEKPAGSVQFRPGRWGCVMWLLAAALQGRTALCDAETVGCPGGGVGMGFGNQYKIFPGSEDCFCYFLSTGNSNWAKGRQVAEMARPFMSDAVHNAFLTGERYIKTPEQVRKFIQGLPITTIPCKYVIFKPLGEIDGEREIPKVVIFLADPDQLSALIVLANYGRDSNENVVTPFAAGCQTIGIYPYEEALKDLPRAVLGLSDISARLFLRKTIGDNLMTMSLPFPLFEEMEKNVAGSFLEMDHWQAILKTKRA
ncbi:MAG: DUF169 domain-containing protein [Smithellaceae bacterium]|nr:DUF169 domain-containing protein [Smithellaceae bacterium]